MSKFVMSDKVKIATFRLLFTPAKVKAFLVAVMPHPVRGEMVEIGFRSPLPVEPAELGVAFRVYQPETIPSNGCASRYVLTDETGKIDLMWTDEFWLNKGESITFDFGRITWSRD